MDNQPKYELLALVKEMENDIDRYPISIYFDPYVEQRELYRRHRKLKAIAERFIRMKERINPTELKH